MAARLLVRKVRGRLLKDAMIREFFHYLFVLCFEASRERHGDEYFDVAQASLSVATILGLNVFAILNIVMLPLDITLPDTPKGPITVVIVASFAVLAIYRYFSRNDRYLKLLAHFGQKGVLRPGAVKRVNLIITASLIFLFSTGVLTFFVLEYR